MNFRIVDLFSILSFKKFGADSDSKRKGKIGSFCASHSARAISKDISDSKTSVSIRIDQAS